MKAQDGFQGRIEGRISMMLSWLASYTQGFHSHLLAEGSALCRLDAVCPRVCPPEAPCLLDLYMYCAFLRINSGLPST